MLIVVTRARTFRGDHSGDGRCGVMLTSKTTLLELLMLLMMMVWKCSTATARGRTRMQLVRKLGRQRGGVDVRKS